MLDILKFYQKEFFEKNSYCSDMPKWLKKESNKELNIIDKFLSKEKDKRILDLGCGNCRIFKQTILKNSNGTKFGLDIFPKKMFSESFKKYLKEKRIKYQRLFYDERYSQYEIPEKLGKFDIIVSFGIDVHLSAFEVFDYLYSIAYKHLNKEGILIWQQQRKNTFKGMWLNFKDKHLNYIYHKDWLYNEDITIGIGLKLESKKETKISNIYKYRKV